jgi:hypothetical protein
MVVVDFSLGKTLMDYCCDSEKQRSPPLHALAPNPLEYYPMYEDAIRLTRKL